MESVTCDSLSQGATQLPTADTNLLKRVKEALSIDLVAEASSFLRLLIAADLFPNGGLYAGPWALSCLAWPTSPDGIPADKPRRRSSNSSRSSAPRTALNQPYWPPQLGPAAAGCSKHRSADLRSAQSTWEEDMRSRLVATLPQAAWLLGRLMEAGFKGSPSELERAVERWGLCVWWRGENARESRRRLPTCAGGGTKGGRIKLGGCDRRAGLKHLLGVLGWAPSRSRLARSPICYCTIRVHVFVCVRVCVCVCVWGGICETGSSVGLLYGGMRGE
ncbi:hypothetical protein Vafri_1556, partial [Volvox africanus]